MHEKYGEWNPLGDLGLGTHLLDVENVSYLNALPTSDRLSFDQCDEIKLASLCLIFKRWVHLYPIAIEVQVTGTRV